MLLGLLLACAAGSKESADPSDTSEETEADTGSSDSETETGTDTDTGGDTDTSSDSTPDTDTGGDTDPEPDDAMDGGGWEGEHRLPGDGSALNGDRGGDQAGYALAIGDLTGDGVADAAVAAPYADLDDTDLGEVFVVQGPIAEDRDLWDELVLEGDVTSGMAGIAIDVADLDGDGTADLVVGAPAVTPNSSPTRARGAVYVSLGPLTEPGVLSDASVVWSAETENDALGTDVAALGDIDDDGSADVALSARFYSDYTTDGGIVYIAGASELESGGVDALGTRLYGERQERSVYFGSAVAGPGDLDGDGVADLAVGASQYSYGDEDHVGAVAVWFGPVSGEGLSSDADALLLGLDNYGGIVEHNHSLAGAGDVDGDGLQDLLIGAEEHKGTASSSYGGQAYLVSGADIDGELDLTFATWSIEGEQNEAYLGTTVAPAGDLDLDGFDDVLVCAPQDGNYASHGGAVLAFQGPLSGSGAADEAEAGFFGTERSLYAGSAVDVGDLNDDGLGDLLIGARGMTGGAEWSGGAFVIPGGG